MTDATPELPPPAPSSVPPKRSVMKRALVGTAAVAVATLGFLFFIGVLGNFRVVDAGKCYRSEQLKPQAIKDAIQSHGIKSVINLRGERSNDAWYKGELAACVDEHVDHADFDIGLGALPKPEVLQRLVEKIEAGPYPILLHCRSGSDRTGLASAFYVHLVEKKPLAEAEAEQVTWRYGHFNLGKARSINSFFDLYHATSGGKPLREWLYQTYPDEYAKHAAVQSKSRVND